MKEFNIPTLYSSKIINKIKSIRKEKDKMKKDFSPTVLDFGAVRFYLARHFGFCYGVENAVEIAYKTLANHPDKKIYLLSQMIHNQEVNNDLISQGVRFIMDTLGNQIIPWENITKEDIVIVPAFGTTVEIEEKLNSIGVNVMNFNTTCPFVMKVWNRAEKLGDENYTIIIHGKHNHEETRATFSHSNINAPVMVIKDLEESKFLREYILGQQTNEAFFSFFKDRVSKNFNPNEDFKRIGIVNQTTMLASETQEISDLLKTTMLEKYGEENYKNHFADTRDTLCYATNDNQQATYALLENDIDLSIVIGGYNSSNTSHIVELSEEKNLTYFIHSDKAILDKDTITHFDIQQEKIKTTKHFLPEKEKVNIILTSGASCPDAVVEKVLLKIISYFKDIKPIEKVLAELEN